ncbi:DUF3320 domain-containing protein [Maioricimonas sp. JC845]|uniref:DUF3320 domain-containing protein n=1 Tax=Maioricimonas sp. JC845 TaxID=3232138 RepID=UPI00345A754F
MTSENPIHRKLETSRRDLLDLTTRNRLISTQRSSTRSGRLEIVDERAEEVFRILVVDGDAMTFLPARSVDESDPTDNGGVHLHQPPEQDGEDDIDEDALEDHHVDLHLQTSLSDEKLQKRLLKLHLDARTSEEEQGVNILYLALGFLKWYEDDKSDRERFAPLLLIPVQLDRKSASSRFRLRYTGDEITTNLSLQEKLKADFGLQLPDVPEGEDLSLASYFAEVSRAVETKNRWEVLPDDIVLWFFSFAKFLMYRDLHPDNWPEERQLENHQLVTALLGNAFREAPPICGESENIDRLLHPLDMIHVMDADSSQTIAIDEVKGGRNLVIQGPPGTGKSQTIANLIATAAREGKKVLFVAEKMAALEVVKRRLDNVGLGDLCLELHSHKANKRAVLEELRHTLSLGRPKPGPVERQAADLKQARDRLNRHAEIMHAHLEPAQVSPFQSVGELVRLRAAGVEPVDFQLVDCETWSADERRQRQSFLSDLAIHMREIGNPATHPWRGVRLASMIPTDVDRLAGEIPPVLERVNRLLAAAGQLANLIDLPAPQTPLEVSRIALIGKRLAQRPAMDRDAIAAPVWTDRRRQIDEIIESGKTLHRCQEELAETVVEIAWSTDVTAARLDLAAYGTSWFRFFIRRYREAQATLRGLLTGPPPKELRERVRILDTLAQGQRARQAIEDDASSSAIGSQAFGTLWQGVRTDWEAVDRIAGWEAECREAGMPEDIRQLATRVEATEPLESLVAAIGKELKPLLSDLQQLVTRLDLDLQVAFGVSDVKQVPLQELADRLRAWQDDPQAISKWIAYYFRWSQLEAKGMGPLAERLDAGLIAAEEVLDRFLMAYHEELMRQAFRNYPELAQFDGVSHEQVLHAFKKLDAERLLMARQEVALAHFDGLPTSGEVGEVGVLRKQMKMKRRHLPLRKLLQQAGHAVQAIKPVFMMSPISIAQYLEPGVLEFDLLLVDEASQVKPVDALGAIARARQMVVVGDDRQLPPTQFFSHVAGDDGDEAEDGDDFQTADVESVLGLCEAHNMPQRMLRWHYRSRHHSLIAVSNQQFYDNRLYVVPSPFNGESGGGLRFRHVVDGVFDRGRSATNRVEAAQVADAVMEHARNFPDKSLGVGAFSVAQRDAIIDELEIRRRNAPELEPFFMTGTAEPFFVKNLENIQGDERAVIFISVGYGRDASGYMGMNFGPLNKEGGERRLNVLITRARERCDVFSSITADDIDLNRTRARGARALKSFLTYARTGILDVAEVSGKEFDSEFELEVSRALEQSGFTVHTQVGVAGFFIDLAVVDPDCPGRYLLGIECDGATYHSSRSARDRDRLRQQVLEDRGWVIHRIWSTDWFHRPDEQLRNVLAAIEHARLTWTEREAPHQEAIVSELEQPEQAEVIDRQEVDLDAEEIPPAVESIPYVEASFQVKTSQAIHEVPADQLARVATKIVQTEGPVHQSEVARRAATIWGLQRTGNRITGAIEEALAIAVHNGALTQTGLFFQPSGQKKVPIRNREDVASRNLRKPDFLPPVEIRTAIEAVVEEHLGVAEDELTREVAKLFGFRSVSSALRQILEDEMQLLVRDGRIERRNSKLYAPEPTVKAFPPHGHERSASG